MHVAIILHVHQFPKKSVYEYIYILLFCMCLSTIRSAENHKAVQLLNILMNEFDQSGFRKKCKEAEAVYKKAL